MGVDGLQGGGGGSRLLVTYISCISALGVDARKKNAHFLPQRNNTHGNTVHKPQWVGGLVGETPVH